jgi:KRAB domain-containing zinc finger protein
MVHQNKKNYKCDLCKYSAFHHGDLRKHIECVHEKIKPHHCNICQKCFGQKGTLKKHIDTVHANLAFS